MQQTLNNQHENILHNELINLFHRSNLPMYFNRKGNKQFTNYQRVALIILFRRSKKSLRDFVNEMNELRWTSWLGLKKIPSKSVLHNWLNQFKMKTIRQLLKLLLPKEIELAAIDGTGIDSWQRSRHYEKRINETHMPYAKADLFVDVKSRRILDFSLVCKHQHDVIAAEQIFKRFKLRGMIILADKGYDSEKLHELVRNKKGILYAPVRKSKRKRPKGRFRRECVELPEFMGQRSIVENVNSVLKGRRITSLSSKKVFMKQREFGWHVVLYNLVKIVEERSKFSDDNENSFFVLQIETYVILDNASLWKVLYREMGMDK